MAHMIPLEHPGEILLEEFIEPMGLTPSRVATETDIPQIVLSEILKGKRGISVQVGLKLSKYFGMSEDYFVRLQMQHDIDKAKVNSQRALEKIIPFRQKSPNPPEDKVFRDL